MGTVTDVPRLSEFYGIAVYMYWRDHRPPHFHAIYGGDEALVRISDGTVFAGVLPRTAARLVRKWAALHREELVRNWELARAADVLIPIEGLR
jgi:hypothetical protein